MIILALILAALQILATLTVYLLMSVGLIDMKKVMEIYEWGRKLVIKGVLYVVRKPLWLQIGGIGSVAVGHQLILLLMPPLLMLHVFMSNKAEEKMLASGLSELGEDVLQYIEQHTWLVILLIPAIFAAIITTFMVTSAWYVATDPHTSSATLLAVCFPVGVSLSMWFAEERFVPTVFRLKVLGTVSAGRITEFPSAAAKRKVLVIAAGTIAAVSIAVIGAHFYVPRILHALMGPKLDPSIYLAGVVAAVAMAAAMAAIQFDGQTKQVTVGGGGGQAAAGAVSGGADADGWDSNSVYSYYHSLLCMTCLIALVAFICFPIINKQFFCYRRLTLAAV